MVQVSGTQHPNYPKPLRLRYQGRRQLFTMNAHGHLCPLLTSTSLEFSSSTSPSSASSSSELSSCLSKMQCEGQDESSLHITYVKSLTLSPSLY